MAQISPSTRVVAIAERIRRLGRRRIDQWWGNESNRIAIANRRDGGTLYWTLRLFAFSLAALFMGLLLGVLVVFGLVRDITPPTPDFARYASVAAGVSRVYADDGTLIGEFADEWREIAPYEKIPQTLIHAFLAAEDHEFFSHDGLYYKGIMRAVWANVGTGEFSQGGSTITQQVAKQFIGSEKSLSRKAIEALLARRLERKYSKKAILSVYLNHIFLGNGAYGVVAAAKRYFGKELDELNVGEMALIAGLAQAPSRYSPIHNLEKARLRRNQVIDKMHRHGFVTAEQAQTWQRHAITLTPYRGVNGETSPYFAEHVRVALQQQFGNSELLRAGLRVETTLAPVTDALAYETVDFGARKQDKRQGWRGPEAHLESDAKRNLFRQRSAGHYGDTPLVAGQRVLALVEAVESQRASVLVGTTEYQLPLELMKWAAPWSKGANAVNDQTISSAASALRVGDVVWVAAPDMSQEKFTDWVLEGTNPRWVAANSERDVARFRETYRGVVALEQTPHPQAALFTADLSTGYVQAMVGGTDFDQSEYNRVTQALRQPGSTWKPIYYSAALDQGYGFDTKLQDAAHAEIDPITGEVWLPQNLGGTIDNTVSLEYSLTFSKNVPSVDLYKMVGQDRYVEWARRLGFTTELLPGDCKSKTCTALALGAASTYLDELTRAFAIFARNGRNIDWIYIRRARDRSGNIIIDNTVYFDPYLPTRDRLDRLAQTAGHAPRLAIPPRTAFLTTKLLRSVITHGFSSIVRATAVPAAGKTGTSSGTMDTSFVAFTSRQITSVWLGDEMRERPLGVTDAAYMTVVPMWARYMVRASAGQDLQPLPSHVPPGVKKNDRGDKRGPQHPMPLLYRQKASDEDLSAPEIDLQ